MTTKMLRITVLFLAFLFFGCQEEKINSISESIVFKNYKDNINLVGKLSLPNKKGKFPAVILISGNGEHNRNAEFGNHKPFLDISNYLTKNGVAVLRYDKRGVGESTGNYSSSNSFDFAEDVNSAIDYLLTRKEIQKNNIGLIGHSEGGLIAPIVVTMSSNVAFIISLAGPSINGNRILLSQQKAIASAKGINETEINKSQQLNRNAFEIVKKYKDKTVLKEKMIAYIKEISKNDSDKPDNMTFEEYVDAQVNRILNPWMVNFLRYNPEQYIKQIHCPVLALNGSKDLQVLAKENLPEWKRILEESGNNNITIKELSGLNHLFQTCETGLPDEYEKINESFSLIAMKEMTKWIKKQIK